MDDTAMNLKYLKCKFKVKKWESDFIKENGIAPSKADIKAAPSKIKEAYRIYWKLKTQVLENSINIDEDAQDCFSLDSSSASLSNLDKSSCDINLSETIDNSCFNVLLNEASVSVLGSEQLKNNKENVESHLANKPVEIAEKESSVKDDGKVESRVSVEYEVNSKNVWGDHLSKKSIESKQPNKSKASVSYSFSDKLFKNFTLNKRNPRKSLKKKKNESSSAAKTEVLYKTNGVEEKLNDTLNISDEAKDIVLTPNKTEFENCESPNVSRHQSSEEPVSVFNLFDEKVKVLIKSTPINMQPTNILPPTSMKSCKNISLTPRSFDKGWLERTNAHNKLSVSNSFDSGIDSGESVIGNPAFPTASTSQNCYLDDEKANDSPPIALTASCSNTQVANESDDDLVCNSDTENSQNIFSLPILTKKRSLQRYKSDNNIEQALKRIRMEHTVDKSSTVESSHNVEPSKKSNKLDNKKTFNMSDNERKEAILRKKVASGKANENFVRINIQKKVFVRGKKNLNFSKYKKQQWKKKKSQMASAGNGEDASAYLKCSKCGDNGHFARNCIRGLDKLIPKEEFDEMEDECPFPSLEEAEELARAVADRMCPKKSKTNLAGSSTTTEDQGTSSASQEGIDDEAPQEPVTEENAENIEKKPVGKPDVKQSAPPLFKLNDDGTIPDTPLSVMQGLEQFGHSSFRRGQEEAVMRIMCGLSTLVTLSTGSGKSLCYQLPAYLFRKYSKEPCITLVISPLISLMEDQIVTMSKAPIKIGCFHMNQTTKQRQSFLDLLKTGDMDVLLVSPEMIVSNDRLPGGLGKVLQDLPPIAFVCIDEAHCISQWSSNFRPSYLMLCKVLKERFGVKTFLGLTATATQITVSGMTSELGVLDGHNGIISDEPLPENLVLTISHDEDKDHALIDLLQSNRFGVPNSVIIYCTRREDCERVAVYIRTRLQFEEAARESHKMRGRISVVAEPYHAGLTAAKRKKVQESFMTGKLRIVVATIAFGMGINKQDIRGIIHYNIPNSFERYVQEVGRAGRDGEPAYCHLFLDHQGGDLNELRRHVFGDSMDRHTIRKLLQRVFVPCRCRADVACTRHEVAFPVADTVEALDLKEESIATLLCYLELHPKRWITTLPNSYTICKVQSYKGGRDLCRAALKCPPLAVAVSKQLSKGIKKEKLGSLSFPIIELAAELGWDSGMLKYHLKQLEWADKEGGIRYRTGILVEFSEVGFRMEAPGNLSSADLDSALDSLHQRVKHQETTTLTKLHTIFETLTSFSMTNVELCLKDECVGSSDKLKAKIRQYFVENCDLIPPLMPETKLKNEDQVASDVRCLVSLYRNSNLTSRSIARIFYGIASPNFPALTMSRNKFWRAHLDQDFNLLCNVAAKVLLSMR
ncbi:ATP-dependent DNA helicase Q4 [Nilaparvata lugens]|uniref:ATP-dependent DNA helicase Q4 n=1 Tax=Nilaparvata lugens TaxID=108931 RepID=UPI00193E7DA2|nr:ATP-dependent DNA helicase Q4 [Nilaparvata lugens]